MNNKIDKRKSNRIQGAWKSSTNKSQNDKPGIGKKECMSELAPQFDNDVVNEKISEFITKEISNDERLDLNSNVCVLHNEQIPAQIELINDFIPKTDHFDYLQYFTQNLPWKQRENVTPTGVKYLEPRQTCWYGYQYSYSSIKMAPNHKWDPKLEDLLNRVQKFSEKSKPFNSVMCNLYRGEKDSIDWHADDEKSLGKYPTIASLSFGTTRAFEMCLRDELFNKDFHNIKGSVYRSRSKNEPPFTGCSILYRVFLRNCSLLIMSGSVQENWLHRVPKEYHDQCSRINFTFRHIIPED